MIDSKMIVERASERAQSVTPSVVALAQVLGVPAAKLVHALDNGNTAEYLAEIVSEFTKLEVSKAHATDQPVKK